MNMEEKDLLLVDAPINLDFGDDKEEEWAELMAQIEQGNVIPVIGPDLILEQRSGKPFHQYLIDYLVRWAGVTSSPRSFSQLLYDRNFQAKLALCRLNNDGIYKLLNTMVPQCAPVPHPALEKLLRTKRFPFVITTSFSPGVELAMRTIWGDGAVRTRIFNNDPRRSEDESFCDISSEKDMRFPTVFYMFGKVTSDAHRYVVTDVDMMEFCRRWMSGSGIPRHVADVIRKRYLLFLGGSYSDWLFRFIWFSIRQSEMARKKSSLVVVPKIEKKDPEDSFPAFLERLQTFTLNDPIAVVDEIEQRLARLEQERRADEGARDSNVFISYSRRDSELADRLRLELEKRGVKVWFDELSIGGGERWREAIEVGIRQAELFVPLLTSNIEKECMEEHEYREEWRIAVERLNRMGGRTFIVPVVTPGFNLENPLTRLPKVFRELNVVFLASDMDMTPVAKGLQVELGKINALKQTVSHGE